MKTHRLKSSNLRLPIIRRDIIHGNPPLALQSQVNHLRHPLIAPVLGPEVQVGRPVVGKVLGEGAGGAGGLGGRVVVTRRHGRVEGVAADDLVHVRGGEHARVDERVETLDGELAALEAHHGCCGVLG